MKMGKRKQEYVREKSNDMRVNTKIYEVLYMLTSVFFRMQIRTWRRFIVTWRTKMGRERKKKKTSERKEE